MTVVEVPTFGWGNHHTARLVHRTSGTVIDHPNGRRFVRWLCGGGSSNPTLVNEAPVMRRRCVRCWLVDAAGGGVYFAEKGGLIKIGVSEQPARRVFDLGATLLAIQPGDIEVEATLHRVFADDREQGEWFRPSPALLTYIERVKAEEPAALFEPETVEASA